MQCVLYRHSTAETITLIHNPPYAMHCTAQWLIINSLTDYSKSITSYLETFQHKPKKGEHMY